MKFMKPKKDAMADLINDVRTIRKGIHFAKNSLMELRYTVEAQHHLDMALFMLQRALDMVGGGSKDLFVDPDEVHERFTHEVAAKLLHHVRGQVLELSKLLIDVHHNVHAPKSSTFLTLISEAFTQLMHAEYFILKHTKPFMKKPKLEAVNVK